MSNITDVFFTIGFVVMIAIFIYKFYNILKAGELYDLKITFLTWTGFLMAWLTGLVSFMASPEETVFITMFTFTSFLLALVTIFTIIEVFMYLGKISVDPKRTARYSNREQLR